MRVLFRWLKRIALGLLALILLAVVALAAVWLKPGLVLNERGVRWALRFAPKGSEVRWSTFHWGFSREGWLGKSTDLDVRDLCFHLGGISGCAPVVKVDVSFSLSHLKPRLTRIGALVLDVSELRVLPAPPGKKPRKKQGPLPDLRPPSFASIWPAMADPARLGDLDVNVRGVRIESAEGPSLEAALRLGKVEGTRFSASVTASQGEKLRASLSGEGEARAGVFAWKGLLDGTTSGWKLHFPFGLRWSDHVELDGSPVAVKRPNRFTSPLTLRWSRSRLDLGLGRLAFDKLWAKKRVLVESCKLGAALDAKQGYPKRSTLHCGVALLSLEQGAILPPLRTTVDADLALTPKGRDTAQAVANLKEQGRNGYLESALELHASALFHPARGGFEGDPALEGSAELRVPELQVWRRALDATPLALPAPLRTLGGPADLKLKLDHIDGKELRLLADLSTDFRGGREALVTRHSALVRLLNPFRGQRSLDINAKDELTDVALEAPPLNFGAPPQFLPDRRIEKSAAEEKKKSKPAAPSLPVHWAAAVTTKAPVRIRTNLLEHEIPVAADLKLGSATGMAGTIRIEPMPISVFKKKAEVQNVTLTFHEGSDVGDVNGTILYHNPEIAVRILLLGSTEKPRVDFESDPPLSRQQIVSVLLFNKSPDELTEEEASSAGSFSQATADGALGLFSLLFLSSTPIESLAYDPVSQTYSARLRLDKKTTLAVGSDFDRERQFTLRRRLGGHWAIRTELHNQQGQPDVLLTLLEWFKRF